MKKMIWLTCWTAGLLLCCGTVAQAQKVNLHSYGGGSAAKLQVGSYHIVSSVGSSAVSADGGSFLQQVVGRMKAAKEAARQAALERGLQLEPNYPNPFTDQTTLRYHVPEEAAVKLTVYDLLGRQVALLVDESQGAGQHEVQFEAHGLPSGVYFYRIEVDGSTRTGRMMLVK